MAGPIKAAKRIFDQFLSKADPESTVANSSGVPTGVFTAQIGSKGGRIGGKRRLETMTSKERRHVAQKAAKDRWSKKTQGSTSKN